MMPRTRTVTTNRALKGPNRPLREIWLQVKHYT
jgi:hypothetical protein